ncbi:SRPBCC domain-containing protein [Mesorhizobium sp.]|uniref:SRPBCC domain-containing protein n=1 Tax=Mesorhizobium sp. TaxID=1871066 RepID=UPI00338F59EF
MTNQQITIATTIAAPIERVWEAYTTPGDITQWNFASDDWCCPSAEADLKVGGGYKARMEAKDGSFGFDFEAVYEEVEPYKAIAFRHERRAQGAYDLRSCRQRYEGDDHIRCRDAELHRHAA